MTPRPIPETQLWGLEQQWEEASAGTRRRDPSRYRQPAPAAGLPENFAEMFRAAVTDALLLPDVGGALRQACRQAGL